MDDSQQESLLEGLRRVGLNRYESSVYLGLVTDQTARVSEISRRTGVPQPKVYQALDSLADKGFCAIGPDAVNRYRPMPPRVALESFLLQLKKEEDSAHQLSDELEILLHAGMGQELWAPPIEIVKGIRQIRVLLVERIREAAEEILFFGKGPQVPALDVAQALWDAGEAGRRLRLVFEEGYFESGEEDAEEDGLYRSMPGEKRQIPNLPTKMLIVDRQVALLSISKSGGEGFLVMMLRHHGLVHHFIASFERHWERARPLD